LVKPLRVQASMVKKSAATITSRCLERNSLQVVFRSRSGAGSRPCSRKMLAIVPCATSWPRLASAPLDSAVAPVPILRSHADYQTLELFSHTRATWPTPPAAIIFPGDQPAMPSQERCRRHDGRQIMKQTPAQFLSPHRQASVLIVIEMQPLASQLLAQHAVLLLKIIEGLLLPLV